jgi:hypothetical protein
MYSVMNITNVTGLIICYSSFRNINFPCFILDFFPVLHVIEYYVEASAQRHLPRIIYTNSQL